MKFYVHCEDPEFTIVVKWEESRSGCIEDISQVILFKNFYPQTCKMGYVIILL